MTTQERNSFQYMLIGPSISTSEGNHAADALPSRAGHNLRQPCLKFRPQFQFFKTSNSKFSET
jgi:hypothetical protein